MKAEHLEILVEEPSMEAFLRVVIPKILGNSVTFNIYPYQCKDDLLKKLPSRLEGYANWLPETYRIVVIIDRDDDNCNALKGELDWIATTAGLKTPKAGTDKYWQIANRIAIEELEAWYFGDWDAVRTVYPRVKETIPNIAQYRDPDAIAGGTWEAFERLLKQGGYFKNGIRKTEVARALGQQVTPEHNRSISFQKLRTVLLDAIQDS